MFLENARLDRADLLRKCAFVCSALVAALIVTVLNPKGAIVSMLSDDAFYYCKIARNIVNGAGCTFDGIARTNGFHPAWMIYSIFVQTIARGDLVSPVIIVIVTNIVFCCATIALLYGVVEHHVAQRFGIVAAAAVLLPNLLTAMLNGMETGLQLFAMVLVLRLCYRRRLLEPAAVGGKPLVLGLMLGVTTLCRLDAVFLFAAVVLMTVGAAAARTVSPGKAFHRLVILCAGFGIAVFPYFVWNFLSFGHLTPISGAVKSTFPALRRSFALVSDVRIGAIMIAVLVVLAAIVFIAGNDRKERWKWACSSPLAMLVLASLAHFANVYFFMSWGVYWWHFTIYGLAIVIALVKAASILTTGRARLRTMVRFGFVVPMIIVAILMKEHELRIKGEQHAAWLRAAEWARDHTADDERFALLDAGLFGYFSERSVMNLDGKANGYEYLEYLERGDVKAYLTERNIRYVANIRVHYVSGEYGIRIRRPNKPSVVLSVKRDWEVYRSALIPSAAPRFGWVPRSYFVIWKFPSEEELRAG